MSALFGGALRIAKMGMWARVLRARWATLRASGSWRRGAEGLRRRRASVSANVKMCECVMLMGRAFSAQWWLAAGMRR